MWGFPLDDDCPCRPGRSTRGWRRVSEPHIHRTPLVRAHSQTTTLSTSLAMEQIKNALTSATEQGQPSLVPRSVFPAGAHARYRQSRTSPPRSLIPRSDSSTRSPRPTARATGSPATPAQRSRLAPPLRHPSNLSSHAYLNLSLLLRRPTAVSRPATGDRRCSRSPSISSKCGERTGRSAHVPLFSALTSERRSALSITRSVLPLLPPSLPV